MRTTEDINSSSVVELLEKIRHKYPDDLAGPLKEEMTSLLKLNFQFFRNRKS